MYIVIINFRDQNSLKLNEQLLGYFMVYFCIIIKFDGSMLSLKYAGRQDGFSSVFVFIVISFLSSQWIIPNEFSKALTLSGFLFSTT